MSKNIFIPTEQTAEVRKFEIKETSNWECHLFGSSDFIYHPVKGGEPNAWVRYWSKVFFNCKWINKENKK